VLPRISLFTTFPRGCRLVAAKSPEGVFPLNEKPTLDELFGILDLCLEDIADELSKMYGTVNVSVVIEAGVKETVPALRRFVL
jgi:hypothetical protein